MLLTTLGLLVQLAAPLPQDHGSVVRAARSAQTRFESIRRANLPIKRGASSTSRCDARIGRFCYWYDSTDTNAEPEHRHIIEARDRLLAALESAARQAPGDGWIAGQRTRYLIEAGRWREAAAAAKECEAERWWCSALLGLALHVGEQYAPADFVYSASLGEMPAERRCEWLDIRVVSDRRWDRELESAPCPQRIAVAEWLWRVSQPLWTTGGNDLRTEHLARRTMAAILDRTTNAHGMSFGADSRELVLRYGWPEWFTRTENGVAAYASYSVTGHDREPSYYFFPDQPSARPAALSEPGSWRFRDSLAPTRYAPRHVRSLRALRHQVARFPRGDSVLVVVAYAVSDTQLAADTSAATVAFFDDGRDRAVSRGVDGMAQLLMASDTVLASVEAYGKSSRRAERARFTIEPMACRVEWCLSDLLLTDPSRLAAVTDAASAGRAARAQPELPRQAPLGVFWELSAVGAEEPVTYGLTVTPIRVSLPRRVAARLRLAPPPAPVRLRWQAPAPGERDAQHVVLRLPPSARGRYEVRLTVEQQGRQTLHAAREIEISR